MHPPPPPPMHPPAPNAAWPSAAWPNPVWPLDASDGAGRDGPRPAAWPGAEAVWRHGADCVPDGCEHPANPGSCADQGLPRDVPAGGPGSGGSVVGRSGVADDIERAVGRAIALGEGRVCRGVDVSVAAPALSADVPDSERPAYDGGASARRHGRVRERVKALVAERARLDGEYLDLLGELQASSGPRAVAHVLRTETRMSASQARGDALLAKGLADNALDETVEAMRDGRLHMAHAKVIAREAPRKHRRSEAEFVELCSQYPPDTVARHPLAYQSQQVWADLAAEAAAAAKTPIDIDHAIQLARRCGSMRQGADGMWNLRARLDAITGRQVNAAVQAAIRQARNNQHNNDNNDTADASTGGSAADTAGGGGEGLARIASEADPTPAQRAADAIAALICGDAKTRRDHTALIIIADYDAARDQLTDPRLDDGTPISAKMLARHATAANTLPAVFKADWSQLALGRTRHASDAQRLILAARDRGCISCAAPTENTQAHHIRHHQHGGPTEIANLALLCPPCHQELHQNNTPIHTPPNGKPQLQPNPPPDTTADTPAGGPASTHPPAAKRAEDADRPDPPQLE